MAVHVRIELDDAVLQRAISDLGLRNPPRFRLNAPESHEYRKAKRAGAVVEHRGRYVPADNRVDIVSTHASARMTPLPVLIRQITFTVLHELRHAWQRENWDEETTKAMKAGSYAERGEEKDANEYAELRLPAFSGLVKVVRKQSGRSAFSRFAETEGRRHA